ncbi:MAG: TIGR02757 family protein [Candidatus Delongbacteria bacterium]|nr:TIGR02757 family protein [Candidatus Delongbacteria bacterium]MBN2834915.1 TIGR02757 family protein [Candidatus Delongbacteria bacterium]
MIKSKLDKYWKLYEKVDFIKDDPISFPHRFIENEDIITAGFIAAVIAQGRRTAIMKNLNILFGIIGSTPANYIENFDYKTEKERLLPFLHFAYRNITEKEITPFFYFLSQIMRTYGNLYNFFKLCYVENNPVETLHNIMDTLHKCSLPKGYEFSPALKMMLAHPANGSSCKRINMFLRWMVRKSEVDFGIFDFYNKSDLLIPLDTHVARISRELGLTSRKQNDMKTAVEITESLKKIDESDPIKYDFALFGYGINKGEDL